MESANAAAFEGLTLIEALEQYGELRQEIFGPPTKMRDDGTPFVIGERWKPIPDAWLRLLDRVRSGELTCLARKRDPFGPREPIPSQGVVLCTIERIMDGVLLGPDGSRLYDLRFLTRPVGGTSQQPIAPNERARPPSKRGRKPLEWDPFMEPLIIEMIRNKRGLPPKAAALVELLQDQTRLVEKGEEREGGRTAARAYLVEHWKFLYDACRDQPKRPGTTMKSAPR